MDKNFENFFNKKYTYAIVGASNSEEKYGFKIVKTLVDSGFNVIPINPKEKEIYGVKTYSSLLNVDLVIDVVDFVVPKDIAFDVLKRDVVNLGIKKVWFQPNTFDENSIQVCEDKGIQYLKDFCLLKSVLDKKK